jgi:hypothetical protein
MAVAAPPLAVNLGVGQGRALLSPVAWRTEIDVRFAPKATRLLRSNEMTRWANKRLVRVSKQYFYSIISSVRVMSDGSTENPIYYLSIAPE